jgi:hypothetical protein
MTVGELRQLLLKEKATWNVNPSPWEKDLPPLKTHMLEVIVVPAFS